MGQLLNKKTPRKAQEDIDPADVGASHYPASRSPAAEPSSASDVDGKPAAREDGMSAGDFASENDGPVIASETAGTDTQIGPGREVFYHTDGQLASNSASEKTGSNASGKTTLRTIRFDDSSNASHSAGENERKKAIIAEGVNDRPGNGDVDTRGADSVAFSASGNASQSDSVNDSVNDQQRVDQADGDTAGISASEKDSRSGRRRGRPKGPVRVGLSVRILKDLDTALTTAVGRTELGPQEIVDEALAMWFRENGIPMPTSRRRSRS
jgi:hypothetical protein